MIRLLTGDCRATLRTLDTGSVQCAITSPPYYSLRDYGTPPLVWGGDAEHEHDFAEVRRFSGSSVRESGAGFASQERQRWFSSGSCVCGAWLGSLGLEPTPELFIEHLVDCFREVRRVLRDDAVCWVNLGDSYAGSGKGPSNSAQSDASQIGPSALKKRNPQQFANGQEPDRWLPVPSGMKPKDLMMIPFRVAMALQADGWWIRSVIPWLKRNSMPESVQGSRFERHQVTVEEYERLSGMRYTRERTVNARSGDMPDLQTSQIPDSETALSAKPEGAGDDEGARAAAGREGDASASQSLTARQDQQSEVRSNRQGPGDSRESDPEVQRIGSRQGATTRTRRTPEVSADLAGTEETSGPTLAGLTKGADLAGGDVRAASYQEEVHRDECADNDGMAGDSQAAPQQMFLLQEEATTPDDGPRHTAEPRGRTSQGERRASVPVMQFEQEQPSDDALVDCPGCDQCNRNDGYVLRMSAGRPSTSTEYVFLLAKSARYYWDADAVHMSDKGRDNAHRRGDWEPSGGLLDPHAALHLAESRNGSGRNRRNSDWWFESWQGLLLDEADDPLALVVNLQPYSGAHFATFPPKLVKPMIKASTSEKGQCPECGAPWVRDVERNGLPRDRTINGAGELPGRTGNGLSGLAGLSGPRLAAFKATHPDITTGWRPSCAHTAEPVPQTCLDPFGGAGTVGLVADRLGRNAILCELKADYAALGSERIIADGPLFADLSAD